MKPRRVWWPPRRCSLVLKTTGKRGGNVPPSVALAERDRPSTGRRAHARPTWERQRPRARGHSSASSSTPRAVWLPQPLATDTGDRLRRRRVTFRPGSLAAPNAIRVRRTELGVPAHLRPVGQWHQVMSDPSSFFHHGFGDWLVYGRPYGRGPYDRFSGRNFFFHF